MDKQGKKRYTLTGKAAPNRRMLGFFTREALLDSKTWR
jgi:hypothetical protein